MKAVFAAIVAIVISVALVGFYVSRPHENPTQVASAGPAVTAPVPATPTHNYEVKDGMEYGYSMAISADAKAAGQVAPKIVMFKYAGQRDGRHQVHTSDGVTFSAFECADPCEVLKVMTFVDKDMLRDTVHVERAKNQPGSIAFAVMQDVLAGRLRVYGIERSKNLYQAWVSERDGYKEYPVAKPAKNSAS